MSAETARRATISVIPNVLFCRKICHKKKKRKNGQDVKCDGRCCTISLSFTYLAFSHLSQLRF